MTGIVAFQLEFYGALKPFKSRVLDILEICVIILTRRLS